MRAQRRLGLRIGILILGILTVRVGPAQAATIPFGVQNDVLLSDVTGSWGWTQIYRDDYSVDSVSIASILASADEWIMIGGIRDGSATIDVLAAVRTSDFTTHTNQNITNLFNGAQWYYNGGSLGFAGAGDVIVQNEADINGLNERDRLSWHTDGGAFIGQYGVAPVNIRYGWRSGDNTGLNGAADWDKIVFTVSAAPEPGTVLLLGTALLGAGVRRWRHRRA